MAIKAQVPRKKSLRGAKSAAKSSKSSISLAVRVWEDELDGGWVAESVDLPGCVSEGETVDEALGNLAEAIAGALAVRMQQLVPNVADQASAANAAARGESLPVAFAI